MESLEDPRVVIIDGKLKWAVIAGLSTGACADVMIAATIVGTLYRRKSGIAGCVIAMVTLSPD